MKKSIVIFLIFYLILSPEVKADNLYLSRTQINMNFDSLEVKAAGFSIGYQWDSEKASPYIEFQMNSNDDEDFDYRAVNFGTKFFFVTKSKFTFGFDVEGGAGRADIKNAQNAFSFLSIGGGVFVDFNITENIGLFLNSKYMHYIDITRNTKCKDSTLSDSIGRGTCSHHGGIDFYQDKIGNAGGLKLSLGLKFSF